MPLDSEEAADKAKLALENRRLRDENRLLKYKLEVLIDMVSARGPPLVLTLLAARCAPLLTPATHTPLSQVTVAKVEASTRAR